MVNSLYNTTDTFEPFQHQVTQWTLLFIVSDWTKDVCRGERIKWHVILNGSSYSWSLSLTELTLSPLQPTLVQSKIIDGRVHCISFVLKRVKQSYYGHRYRCLKSSFHCVFDDFGINHQHMTTTYNACGQQYNTCIW